MPRQQLSVPESMLPSNAEDPVERRRLLNVIAQRRYRERKRARAAAGQESSARSSDTPEPSNTAAQATSSNEEQSFAQESANFEESGQADPELLQDPSYDTSIYENPSCASYLNASDQSANEFFASTLSAAGYEYTQVGDIFFPTVNDSSSISSYPQSTNLLEQLPFQQVTRIETPTQITSHSRNNLPFDPSGTRFYFSDEAFIDIPALTTVEAHFLILQRMQLLGCRIDIWDPHAQSPFFQPTNFNATDIERVLPENYRPTQAQRGIKHHPIFDLLPWPSVRNRLLHIMSLPIEARPEHARDDMPNVMAQMVLDMKDAAGGLRVWGTDPFNENNWEVGQVFFDGWWWALRGDIVKNSNAWRRLRGADELRFRKQ